MNDEGKILDPLQVNEKSIEETQEFYKSKYGDFNRYQEGLLLYLKSKKSLLFVTLNVMLFLVTLVSVIIIVNNDIYAVINSDVVHLNWVKPFFIIILLVAVILPTAYIMIYIGGRKFNFTLIKRGLKLAKGFIRLMVGVLYLAAILFVIVLLNMLFINFLFGLIFGFIIGLFIWFYINYYKVIIDFIDRCILTLDQDMTNNIIPHTDRLRSYYLWVMVLTVISQIINLFSGNSNAEAAYDIYGLDRFEPLVWISVILSLLIVIYNLFLINNIHDFFHRLNYNEKQKLKEYKRSLTD